MHQDQDLKQQGNKVKVNALQNDNVKIQPIIQQLKNYQQKEHENQQDQQISLQEQPIIQIQLNNSQQKPNVSREVVCCDNFVVIIPI